MGLFDGGSGQLVGLDIGSAAVKVAHLGKTGKTYKLTHFGQAPLPEGAILEDGIHKEEEVSQAIVAALKKAEIHSKNICLGLYGPNTFVRRIQIEGSNDREELLDQVEWEAEQYLPFSVDDGRLDFHIVGDNKGGGIDVIVGAVKEDTYEAYTEILRPLKLKLKSVDLNLLSFVNIFEMAASEEVKNSSDSHILLDIGAQSTGFVVYRDGLVIFSKDLAIGGAMFTEEIQRQMGVNYVEAEGLKMATDSEGNLPEDITRILDQVTEMVISEIHQTLEFYLNSSSDEGLVACHVLGGGAKTLGLLGKLEQVINLSVKNLSPFDVLKYNSSRFSKEDIQEISQVGSVAMGLGLKKG